MGAWAIFQEIALVNLKFIVGVEATQKQGPTIQLCGALVRQRTDEAIASV